MVDARRPLGLPGLVALLKKNHTNILWFGKFYIFAASLRIFPKYPQRRFGFFDALCTIEYLT
jgi:hypothetical protein